MKIKQNIYIQVMILCNNEKHSPYLAPLSSGSDMVMWMMFQNIHSLQGKEDSISTVLKHMYVQELQK